MQTTGEKFETAKLTGQEILDMVFLEGRTHHAWLNKEVPDALLKQAYSLARMGPTSANCNPMRLVFVKTKEAKERLKPSLMEGNVNQTMAAPVTAIISYDMEFYEQLPRLFPHADAKAWFVGNPDLIYNTAFRNGTLQGAYYMLALRAVGLDIGPMSGFNNDKVDKEFLNGTNYKSNWLCNIGYGDVAKLHPRDPRFEFSEIAKIL